MTNSNKKTFVFLSILAVIVVTAVIEYLMGRSGFCKCGVVSLWSGGIWSNQNSQQFADPYTFSHIIHGVLFYGILRFIFRDKISVMTALFIAVCFEAAWEIAENSSYVIERYREATISLDYYGDSIFNSISDIFAMMLGFFIAYKLPWKVTALVVIITEILLLFWIRDNLTLNIIMLIHPVEAIKVWQMGLAS